jgi:hypothetical protein
MTDPTQTLLQFLGDTMLACLCSAVSTAANPPQHCAYRVGIQVAADVDATADLCCEGLAYVMPGDMWPSFVFPDQDITRQANAPCTLISWAQEFKMGILRCVPTTSNMSTGDMPTDAQWNTAAVQTMIDNETIRRAFCCFKSTALADPRMIGLSIVAGRMQQGEVQGGCVERFIPIQVQVPGDCCFG